jgi:glycosyltransferase involved in cell wall biosynthesis
LWQAKAQQRLYQDVDAIVVHSQYGRAQLVGVPGVDPSKVHVIHHGAFAHLLATPPAPLPQPLADSDNPVVLFFGLLRQYKGIETLLTAWRGIERGELWIVGRPRMPLEPLRRLAPARVRFVPRFVNDNELVACFSRAEIVVLPYTRTERFDQSGVLAIALAFGKAIVLTDIGGFAEVAATGAAELIKPDDPSALHAKLVELLESPGQRARLAAASRAAAEGPYSWDAAARQTLALYEQLVGRHPAG